MDTTQTTTALAPSHDPSIATKARITAAMLGLVLTEEQHAHINTLPSTAEANKYIMYLKNMPPTEVLLTDDAQKLLDNALSPVNSNAYTSLKSDLNRHEAELTALIKKQNNLYPSIHYIRLKMRDIEEQSTASLAPAVKKVIEDGWYTLYLVHPHKVQFLTSEVHCIHKDAALGIDLSVNLGRFSVSYGYEDGYVEVWPYQGNVSVSGIYHPHIAIDKHVCWGTANAAVNEYRKVHNMHGVLTALRTLLAVYNPESPYRRLVEFDFQVNKSKYEGKTKVYVPVRTIAPTANAYAWIRIDNEPPGPDYIEERGDEDDEDYANYKYPIYMQVYEGTLFRSSEDLFIKLAENKYSRLGLYTWEY